MKTDLDSRLREVLLKFHSINESEVKLRKILGEEINPIDQALSAIKDEFLKLVGEDEEVTGYMRPQGYVNVDLTASYNNAFRAELRSLIKGVK